MTVRLRGLPLLSPGATTEEILALTAFGWGYGLDLRLQTVLTSPRPLGAFVRLYSPDDSDLPRAHRRPRTRSWDGRGPSPTGV